MCGTNYFSSLAVCTEQVIREYETGILVIAHNNPEILRYQLELLDSVDTAFYIHIDKHADMDKKKLRNAVKRSYIELSHPKRSVGDSIAKLTVSCDYCKRRFDVADMTTIT